MTDDLFSPDVAVATVDPNKNYVEELVGDGKKFKTIEDLARGKVEADLFIEDLKVEKRNLYEDYVKLKEEEKTRTRLEEIVNQISQASQNSPEGREPTRNDGGENNKSVFDPKEIGSLVSSKLQELRKQEQSDANLKLVKEKLTEKYGANYPAVLKETTRKLGLSDTHLSQLAAEAPSALFSLIGMDRGAQVDNTTPPKSSFSLSRGEQKKTYSYFDKIRKEDPTKFNSPHIQNERRKAMREMSPEEFFDVE